MSPVRAGQRKAGEGARRDESRVPPPLPAPTVPSHATEVHRVVATQRVKMADVKVLHTDSKPWRVEVRSVPQDFRPAEGQLVKFTVGLNVNGCGFNAGDLAVLPLETAVHWRPFLTLLM